MTGSRPHRPIPRDRAGSCRWGVVARGAPRLEFAAFSVKSRVMKTGGDGIFRWRRDAGVWPTLASTFALAAVLLAFLVIPANAQLFGDRPPPIPPAAVPDPGGAVSLAPPSGPAAGPPPG